MLRRDFGRISRFAARITLALVFIISIITKISSSPGVKEFLAAIPWFSGWNRDFILYLTVTIEVVISTLLIFQKSSRFGGFLAFTVLSLFTVLLAYASYTQVSVPCGCFGELLAEASLDNSIFRNILLLLLSVLVISTNTTGRRSKDQTYGPS